MFLINFKNGSIANNSFQYIRRSIVSSSYRQSAKNPTKNAEESDRKAVETYRPLTEDEIQKIVNMDNIHIVTKFQQKLPQRPPLAMNFFIGKIDTELLTYPQVMEVNEFNEMVSKQQPISNYFADSARTPAELRFRDVSNQMLTDFKSMKLFGASVHQRFSGSGLFKSEMNLASESEANDIKSYLILAGHRLAVEAIADHGNVSHHNQYLMEMAKGELIGAVCLHDPLNISDTNKVNVSQAHDGGYVLNGSRSFAICSQHANVLVVIAEKSDELKKEFEIDEDDPDNDDFIDAYMTIVLDPHTSGITFIEEDKTIGCNDVPFVTVNFSNVHIGKDQILTEGIDDRKISQKLLTSSRLQAATLNMVQARNILNHLIKFTICTECDSEKLRDLPFVRQSLAKLACELYGLESMIYLTTAIFDQYDNPKVDMECAISKAYSQDILQNLTKFAMNLIATPVTIAGHSVDLDIQNAIQLQYNETSAVLKNYVATTGMTHATYHFGNYASDHKDSIWLKIGLASNATVEDLKPINSLGNFVHPSLVEIASDLDYSIQRLQYCAEMILNRYKDSATKQHTEIQALGETLLQNYAMFASIGRASRAYCVGLRYSTQETVVAGCLIQAFSRKIREMALDVKHKRSGFLEHNKTIADNAITQYKNQSIPVPSVLYSGVIQKIGK